MKNYKQQIKEYKEEIEEKYVRAEAENKKMCIRDRSGTSFLCPYPGSFGFKIFWFGTMVLDN